MLVVLMLAVITAFVAHVPMLRREGCLNEIYVFSVLMLLCVVFGALNIINPNSESLSNELLSIFRASV